MAIALVQQATGTSGGTASMAVTISAPVAGNILVCCIGGTTTNGTNLPTCTNVTWAKVVGPNTITNAEIYVGTVGASPGTTVTVTAGVAHSYRANVSEWSGADVTGAAGIAATVSASTSPATGSITPTAGVNALLIAVSAGSTGAGSAPTNSFTALSTANSQQQYSYRLEASTSGSYSTGWTWSIATTSDTLIAVFKAPSVSARRRIHLIS